MKRMLTISVLLPALFTICIFGGCNNNKVPQPTATNSSNTSASSDLSHEQETTKNQKINHVNESSQSDESSQANQLNEDIPVTPVDLTSLNPYFEGTIDIFTNGEKDIMGNTYRTGIRGYMSQSDSERYDCYDIWDIGGKYNTLRATGIVLESDKGSSHVASYKIYGDNILLYEKSDIDSKTKTYQIEVDITGVTNLKIEMYGEGNDGWEGIDSVLVDITLQ